ncbi:phage tail protein [Yersinia bercovieri]|uniref:phage tail protein n=1 Tax=Yersinia bercovieri TaxID=634 RepID=UPI0005E679F6|nr:phage tail protein [Yersinia bercovieri]CNJ10384.1 putative bacteriophage tail fiber protein [Yersinia bercovieri]
MHRIDTPTAQVDKFGAGKNGFTRGNPQTGVPATALDDDYFDAVQEEIAKVIESTGVALNKNNRAQLLAAIQHLITQGIPDLKDASLSQKGVVQLSNATNSTSQTLAATPKAVSDLGALLLKIGNNLSEIKDAGPAAVAQTLLNLGLGDGSLIPIGIPLPYPLSAAPAGWLKCNGSTFSKATYPKLALVYPSGVLPDMRGNVIRGWDDGRGIDAGRVLLSFQDDAIRNITGIYAPAGGKAAEASYFSGAFTRLDVSAPQGGQVVGGSTVQGAKFDASLVVPTANENRMKNIAFNYIVRAA